MQDFLRMQTFPLLSGLVTLLVILALSTYILKGLQAAEATPEELRHARSIRSWILIIFGLGWGYWLAQTAILNTVPKNTIDRSVVDSRADTLEKNAQERLQEKTPE